MGLLRGKVFLAAFFIACLSPSFAQEGGVRMMHDAWWSLSGRDVVIHVSQIANESTEDTGPLFLSLYAQSGRAYDTGDPAGQLIVRAPIDSLAAGETKSLDITARARAVRPGQKFTALMVERKEGRRYVIVEWISFTSLYNFTRRQNGGVGSDDSAIGRGDIAVSSLALSAQGRRATFNAGQIQSQRETDPSAGSSDTGTLRLAVYATSLPYEGGPVEGQLIGSRVLGRLSPGDYYTGLQGTITTKRPRGRQAFYTTMVLEEDQDGTFAPVYGVSAPPP